MFSNFLCSLLKVQELESSDQVTERFNVVQQEKLTLDGRVIQLESMIRQKDEVSVSSMRGRGGERRGGSATSNVE